MPNPSDTTVTILAHLSGHADLRTHLVLGDDLLLFGGNRSPGDRYHWSGMRLAELPGRFGRRVVIRYRPGGGTGPEAAFMIGSVPEDSAAVINSLWRWHDPCAAERRWRRLAAREAGGGSAQWGSAQWPVRQVDLGHPCGRIVALCPRHPDPEVDLLHQRRRKAMSRIIEDLLRNGRGGGGAPQRRDRLR